MSKATITPYDLAGTIIAAILQCTGIRQEVFFGASRTAYVSKARDTAAYLIRENTELSHDAVARLLKRNSHLASYHACGREALRLQRNAPKRIGVEQSTHREWHKHIMAKVQGGD